MSQDAALNVADRDQIVACYKRLRAVCRKLNQELVRTLSKEALLEGARKLGILQNGVFCFNTQDESSVLMDYCLYDVRRNGRNAVEQRLIDSPADPESDEMACLRAMQQAIYSLFIVESVEPGLGVIVQDVPSNETLLVVDLGFGSTAQPGLVFASRMLPHEGFYMTGGAALPVAVLPADRRSAVTRDLAAALTPGDNGYVDPAPLIRACQSRGGSSRVRYQEPSGGPARQQRGSASRPAGNIGRNAPCPCGSGEKFKRCCMRES